MLPTLQIGPFAMQTPGLIIILGIWIGLTLVERLSPACQTDPNKLYNLVFILLIAGIIGARLTYAIRYLDIFMSTPLNIFSLNPGLLDPIGGIGVGLIAGLIYANRNNLSLWPTLDAFTPFFGVMMIAIALSQLASGDAFGLETNIPWGIELWGTKRHPTQIYYTLTGITILGIVWPWREAEASTLNVAGSTFLSFTALSAAARLFLDAFRADSELILSGVRTSQVIAWITLALSLWGLSKIRPLRIQSDGEYENK